MNYNFHFRKASLLILLIVLSSVSGCIRRTISQSFGLSRRTSSTQPSRKTQAQAATPDASLRGIFRKQVQTAFDPLTDDKRVQTLRNTLKANPENAAVHLE